MHLKEAVKNASDEEKKRKRKLEKKMEKLEKDGKHPEAAATDDGAVTKKKKKKKRKAEADGDEESSATPKKVKVVEAEEEKEAAENANGHEEHSGGDAPALSEKKLKKKKKKEKERLRREQEEAAARKAVEEAQESKEQSKKKKKKKRDGSKGATEASNGAQDAGTFKKSFYTPTERTAALPQSTIDKFYEKHSIKLTDGGEVRPVLEFADANLEEKCLKVCAEFEKPTPIQSTCWPLVAGGRDVIGIAEVRKNVLSPSTLGKIIIQLSFSSTLTPTPLHSLNFSISDRVRKNTRVLGARSAAPGAQVRHLVE